MSTFNTLFLACALCLISAPMLGCEDEPVTMEAPPPPPPRATQGAPAGRPPPARKGGREIKVAQAQEVRNPNAWEPADNSNRDTLTHSQEDWRDDPFYSFVEQEIAALKAQEDTTDEGAIVVEVLPQQRFAVTQFQLIALITNTAVPKALFLAPDGNTYTLSPGDLIGNRSGVIMDITRGQVEVLQGEGLESSTDFEEGTERVFIRLHPENPRGVLNCAIDGKTCVGVTPLLKSEGG